MPQQIVGEVAARPTLHRLELRCPPLPQTLLEALELMKVPEKMDVGPMVEIVRRDPVVAARLLHTANSSYYGVRQRIGSVDRAVVMLGPVAVAGVVLGMHMLRLQTILESPTAACIQRLVRHSTAAAYLTRYLLDRSVAADPIASNSHAGGTPGFFSNGRDISFTCGLLHDFGKIIFLYNFQEEALRVYGDEGTRAMESSYDLLEAERRHFGCDHTEAGAFAARKLHFPDALVEVIRGHHQTARQSADPTTQRLIRLTTAANIAAKAMGFAHDPVDEAIGDLAENATWKKIIEPELVRGETPRHLAEELLRQQPKLDRYIRETPQS